MGGAMVEFTDANWKAEVLESATLVLVDFWAPWCPPCRALTPLMEKMAAELQGKVKIGKMNIDENPVTPPALRISSIPTISIYQGGREVERLVGANSEAKYKATLAKYGVA